MHVELIGIWHDGLSIGELPSNTSVQIDMARGEGGNIDLLLVDDLGQPVQLDLAGSDTLTLSASPVVGNAPVIIKVGAVLGTEPGRYRFTMVEGDTKDMSGTMAYDVWAVRGGVPKQVVRPGYLKLGLRVKQ